MRKSVWLCMLVAFVSRAPAVELRVDVLLDQLENPWGLELLPDGRMLMTERAGRLWLLDAQGRKLSQIRNVPPAFVKLQGGLFDVVRDPAFDTNALVYLSLAQGEQRHNTTRVVRARLAPDSLEDVQVIFDGKDKGTAVHYGARLGFLPDKTLLVTVGEGAEYREDAQRLSEMLGKVARINTDGTVPADNPFVGRSDADPRIWSYGHRNSQGLAIADGFVFSTEHGPMGGDELNVISPGANYGWPIATHGLDYTDGRISPFVTYPGVTEPIVHWTPSPGLGGVAIYHGAMFPEWEGDALVGAMGKQHLKVVDLEGTRVVGERMLLDDRKARFRQIKVAPDGSVLVLIDAVDNAPTTGQLLRITRAAPIR
jgi:glucose/arabinose dehydrogenase